MIRLVAIDMDGTLLNRRGEIPLRNTEAVKWQQKNGREIMICTGRSYHDTVEPLRRAGIRCRAVCMNGAARYDQDGKVEKEILIDAESVKTILDLTEQYGLLVDIMTDRGSITTAKEEYFHACFEAGELLPVDELNYEEIRSRFTFTDRRTVEEEKNKIYKISLITEKANLHVLDQVRQILNGLGTLNVASSAPNNLELTSRLASKGQALQLYTEAQGYALREVAAIGDSENDLSMMKLELGLKVAMGNAAACIKDVADLVTDTNEEAGVARFLNALDHKMEKVV